VGEVEGLNAESVALLTLVLKVVLERRSKRVRIVREA
jgi:hypothetical protein